MKCMSRNKVRFFYSLYEKRVPVTDEYGNATGEYDVIHGKPIEFFANVSAAQGEATTRMFGDNESYDKVIVMDEEMAIQNDFSAPILATDSGDTPILLVDDLDYAILADWKYNEAPTLDIYSVLWVDTVPLLDNTGALALDESGKVITPYDYIVKKVAKSLNSVSIAISKVKVQ